ncbi:interleukin-12 subunit beta-like isoform X2 [Hyperolius riggenbachi]|uniref:interleukin-12 subunit beta-like isoform X2 n=1 Tax=Hyperolius riggenbachi TaxID=752182 RepID=UPI0035A29184
MKMFQQFFSFVLLMSGFQRFQALSSPSADLSSLMVRCQTDSYTNSHLNCSIHEDFLCPCVVTANAYRNGTLSPSITKHFTSEEVHDMHFPVSIAQVFCAYGEHMEGIHLSVKVMTEKEYWHINTTIIMADIVVPGPPENGKVTCNQISWRFPSNWSESSTFFPLLFLLDLKMRDDRRVRRLLEGQTNYQIKDVEEFRVQCRDLFSDTSPWSAWSPIFRREC